MGQTLLFPDPQQLVERLGLRFFHALPAGPGVYLMRDAQEGVLYVGKAKNLKQRLNSYRVANPDRLSRRHLRLLRAVARIELQACADEAAALAREAELLRALKPKFNRAGTWPAPPRHLVWRWEGPRLALAISEGSRSGWGAFGPFGGGIAHLRAALARLLWCVFNPTTGAGALPAGWLHGRLGAIAWVAEVETATAGSGAGERLLAAFLATDAQGFAGLALDQTQSLRHRHEVAMRDADLETVVGFLEAKARRPGSWADAGPPKREPPPEAAWLFPERTG